MAEDIVLTEDWHIALCVIYLLGAVVSLWMILLSPYLIEWLGATLHKRPKGDQKDWAKIFLFVVLFQPVTFVVLRRQRHRFVVGGRICHFTAHPFRPDHWGADGH